jgi:hypothetical protein
MTAGKPVPAGTTERCEVTRAVCWLPKQVIADRDCHSITSDGYSLVRETRRLIGRIGYLVITEAYQVQAAENG